MAQQTGKAYAFFNCNASKEAIEREIPFIRKCAQTPNGLELSLIGGMDSLRGDSEIQQMARETKHSGIRLETST